MVRQTVLGERTVTAEELTFGVEIEQMLPNSEGHSLSVGGYHLGRQVPWLTAGWNAQHDGSIIAKRGFFGAEIVSPILKGQDGIDNLANTVKALNDRGSAVNSSCGLHVHVGIPGVSDRYGNRGIRKAITRLVVRLVSNHERGLYALTGTKSRETGTYSKSIRNCNDAANNRFERIDRYRLVNVRGFATGCSPTLEFRLFSASVNSRKIIAFVNVALAIVEKALSMKKATNRIPKKATVVKRAGSGEGVDELVRLFYNLGMTKGKSPRCFGILQHGSTRRPGVPNLEESKKILLDLAVKYDGGGADENPAPARPARRVGMIRTVPTVRPVPIQIPPSVLEEGEMNRVYQPMPNTTRIPSDMPTVERLNEIEAEGREVIEELHRQEQIRTGRLSRLTPEFIDGIMGANPSLSDVIQAAPILRRNTTD